MTSQYGRIVTDNLVFAVDALDPNSYQISSSIWYDMSPNRYTGSITGAPQLVDYNKGLYFDGVNYYSKFLGITPVQLASASLSVNIIFRLPSDFQNGSNALFVHDFDNAGVGGNAGWRIDLYPEGASYIGFTLSSVGGYYNTNLIISPNKTYNITFTKTGSTLYCYNNDVLSNTVNNIFSYPIHAANSYVFSRVFFGSTAPCMATIYATRVYTKALSQQEITQNYLAHKSRFGI